jgi:hypothetical protein
MDGDLIEVKPAALMVEHRDVSPPQVIREDHDACTQMADVCIASVPIIEHRCDESCHVCVKCSLVGCYPWRCCDTVCQDVHAGDRCVATQSQCVQHQNQWRETSIFTGLGAPVVENNTAPMKSAQLMSEGLKLRFSIHDPTHPKQVECALGSFNPEIGGEKFSFTVRDVDGCPPLFGGDKAISAGLTIVNQIKTSIPYFEGKLVKNWDGSILERPVDRDYLPSVGFTGTISVFAQPLGN